VIFHAGTAGGGEEIIVDGGNSAAALQGTILPISTSFFLQHFHFRWLSSLVIVEEGSSTAAVFMMLNNFLSLNVS